jgi:hypothetical protein
MIFLRCHKTKIKPTGSAAPVAYENVTTQKLTAMAAWTTQEFSVAATLKFTGGILDG